MRPTTLEPTRVPADLDGDPIRELFVAQSERPAELREVNLRALTPFQRVLLVVDGTVTKFIEAFTMEAVQVVQVAQSTRGLPADHHWLAAPAGTEVIAREVLLQGRLSGRTYAYAASLIVPGRVPADFLDRLATDSRGIGGALLGGRVESMREILWYGRERPQALPAALSTLTGRDLLSRTYRVVVGGQPLMMINEKFPLHDDPVADHH
jgi:chorismate-pyruvate lyase